MNIDLNGNHHLVHLFFIYGQSDLQISIFHQDISMSFKQCKAAAGVGFKLDAVRFLQCLHGIECSLREMKCFSLAPTTVARACFINTVFMFTLAGRLIKFYPLVIIF